MDRSSSDGELPEAGCGDSSTSNELERGRERGRKESERRWEFLKSKHQDTMPGCSSPMESTVGFAELIIQKQRLKVVN